MAIGELLKTAVQGAAEMPLTATLGASMVAGALKPAAETLIRDPMEKEIKGIVEERAYQMAAARKADRLRRIMALNTTRLARLDPQTYNEVLAGRRLATGAAVFGGRPRTDMMDMLASQMASGQIAPQRSAEDTLADFM